MSARPTFRDRPFDYLLTQREGRDPVRYASAIHQLREHHCYPRGFLPTLYALAAVALLVIWVTR